MPGFVRDALADTWRRQQLETARARARIWHLVAAVEALEKQTWDRDDAVEDMGDATGQLGPPSNHRRRRYRVHVHTYLGIYLGAEQVCCRIA